MPDPFRKEPKGFFASGMDWLDELAQVPKNVLRGDLGAVGRHTANILGDAVDAFLPGDWIPDFTRPEDYVSSTDLIGLDEKEHPLLSFGANLVGDTLLNPATYIPGAAIAKGVSKLGGLASSGISKLPEGEKILEGARAAGRTVRSAFGVTGASPEVQRAVDDANNLSGLSAESHAKAVAEVLSGLSPEDQKIAFQIINNTSRDAAGKAVEILPGSDKPLPMPSDFDNGMLRGVEEAGQQVMPLTAEQSMAKVVEDGSRRPTVDPLSEDIGIHGVAPAASGSLPLIITKRMENELRGLGYPPEAIRQLTPKEANSILESGKSFKQMGGTRDPLAVSSEAANAAAHRTLEQAFPLQDTPERFASGIEMANKDLLKPGSPGRGTPTMVGEKSLAPIEGLVNEEAQALRASARSAKNIDHMNEQMLSGAVPKATAIASAVDRSAFDTVEGHMERFGRRIDAMGLPPEQAKRLRETFAKWLPYVQRQYREAVEGGALYKPVGIDAHLEMPVDYVQRKFTGLQDAAGDIIPGGASSAKGRVLGTGESFRDFLNDPKNAGVSLDENLLSAASSRGAQQAQMLKSAKLGKGLLEDAYDSARAKQSAISAGKDVPLTPGEEEALKHAYKAFNEEGVGAAVKTVLNDMHKAGRVEDAKLLKDSIFGLEPRGALTGLLAKTNRVFKPAAVYGFAIPKLGSDVRNAVSAVWQTLSNPEARQHTWEMAKQLLPNILKSLDDGLEHMFGVRIGKNEFAEYEQALRAGGGQASAVLGLIKDPTLAAAVRQGVLGNNFVTAEQLISQTAKHGAKKWLGKIADLPGILFRGTEQRARYILFKALTKAKMKEGAAGKIVRDTFYDYGVTSVENRRARDFVPFFQFSAKAIPQQAKLLTEKPWLATGLASAMTNVGGSDPVYPYMEGKLNVPIGADEQGNDQYVSGFGLPFETLASIPNPSGSPQDFGRDIERSIVGSSNPLLKTAFAAVAGEDPFFQTPYGSYDKAPIVGHAGDAGRMYNELSGTGLIEPLDQPLRSIDKLLDDRRSGGVKALDLLTGANVVNVDPAIALRQQLEQALASDPSIQQHRSFFDSTKDPKAQALLAQYKEAQKKVKAKRKHAPASLGTP